MVAQSRHSAPKLAPDLALPYLGGEIDGMVQTGIHYCSIVCRDNGASVNGIECNVGYAGDVCKFQGP